MTNNAVLQILIKVRDEASQALGNVEKQTGSLTSKLGALATGLVAAAGAYVSFQTIKGAIDSTQQLGDAVYKLNTLTGMGAQASSDFIFALHHAGVDADAASVMLGRFSKNMFGIQVANEDGTAPAKTTAAALHEIGVNALDASGNIRPLQDMIYDAADAFHGMAAGATKDAVAVTLFGRSGLQMLPLLNLGSQGMKDLAAEAKKLGVELTTGNMVAIHNYTLAQRDMSEATGGLKLMIGEQLMPVITRLETWFISVQPQVREFASTVGADLVNAFNAAKMVISPVTDLLGKMSNRDIILMVGALAAALTGTLAVAFGIIVVSATAAFIAENAALLGIPILVAAAVVAITMLVTHWNAVWGALQAAPASLLAWLKSNWTDVLIGVLVPGGLIIELVKHWGDIWNVLPQSVQVALDRVYNIAVGAANGVIGAFEFAINKVISGFDSLANKAEGILSKVTGGLVNIDVGMGQVSLGRLDTRTVPQGSYAGTMDAFLEANKKAKKSVEDLLPPIVDLNNGLGTGGSGGGGGGTVAALSAADKAFLDLAGAVTAAGLTGAQFIQFVDLMTSAGTILNLTLDQMGDVFHTSGLSVSDFDERLQAIVGLDQLKQQAKDAMDAVTGLSSAFDTLHAAPTKEQAASNLQEAALKLQKAILESQGADASGKSAKDKQLKAIEAQIAQMDKEGAVRQAYVDVQKAQLTVANATLLTNAAQNVVSGELIDAMKTQSYMATLAGNTYYWSSLKLQEWTDQLGQWMDAAKGHSSPSGQASVDAWNALSDAGKAWVVAHPVPSFGGGGVMPYTGLAHLEKGETVLKPGQSGAHVLNVYGGTINIRPQSMATEDVWATLEARG